jgi:hypothetical protein
MPPGYAQEVVVERDGRRSVGAEARRFPIYAYNSRISLRSFGRRNHPSLRLEIAGLWRGQRRKLAAVGLDVE